MLKNHFITEVELLKEKINDNNIYPFSLPSIKSLYKLKFHKNVTFIIWENWTWKSTLLEWLAVNYWFNPEWGSKNFNFSTNNTYSNLSDFLRISKWINKPKDSYFLRAESFYNLATNIDEIQKDFWWIHKSYWWKSLHKQSHWESFFSLFINRFFWDWIYILDEPESALSPQRQIAFLLRIDQLVKQNSQFIIATHSPIILSYPNAKIIEINEKWYNEVEYEDSEHFSLYKTFLNNPDYMLKKLWINKN